MWESFFCKRDAGVTALLKTSHLTALLIHTLIFFLSSSLENNKMGDVEAEHLASVLSSLSSLKLLKSVSHVSLNSAIRYKISLWKCLTAWSVTLNSFLRHSSLSQNCIGDAGVRRLSQALASASSLQSLRYDLLPRPLHSFACWL